MLQDNLFEVLLFASILNYSKWNLKKEQKLKNYY